MLSHDRLQELFWAWLCKVELDGCTEVGLRLRLERIGATIHVLLIVLGGTPACGVPWGRVGLVVDVAERATKWAVRRSLARSHAEWSSAASCRLGPSIKVGRVGTVRTAQS